MTEVAVTAVSGTVIDAPLVQSGSVQTESTALTGAFSAITPTALAEAAKSDETTAEFTAKLKSVYDGIGVQIVALTHARTVTAAYAVRLADARNGGKPVSAEVAGAALRALDPEKFKGVTSGRISQLRNAAAVLIDLQWPLSDPTVGKMLNATGISKPLATALETAEKEGVEAGRARFRTDIAEAIAAAAAKKAQLAETKRLAAIGAQAEGKGTPEGGGDDTSSREPQSPEAPDTADLTPGSGVTFEERFDRMMVAVNALDMTSAEDYALLVELIDAIRMRLTEASEGIAEAGQALADARIAQRDAETAKLRKSTPKPRSRSGQTRRS